MTTIASDGRTVACDSQRVLGSECVDLSTTKIKIRRGNVFALTGDFAFFDTCIEWFLAGCDPEKAPKIIKDGSWSLLVFRSDGIARYLDTTPYIELFPYPYAFGSGSSYALAALRLGASSEEAVKVASDLDVWTGGPVQVVNIAEALGLQRLEAAE